MMVVVSNYDQYNMKHEQILSYTMITNTVCHAWLSVILRYPGILILHAFISNKMLFFFFSPLLPLLWCPHFFIFIFFAVVVVYCCCAVAATIIMETAQTIDCLRRSWVLHNSKCFATRSSPRSRRLDIASYICLNTYTHA